MDINKSFKIIFNSNTKVGGSTNNNANYYLDWSAVLKDNQQYTMSWSYYGQTNNLTGNCLIATVNMNLFANIFMANGTFLNGAINTQNIGVLSPKGNGLYGDINFNTPIHFNSRPTNNNVNIQILNNDNPPIEWLDNATVPVEPNNYILILTFSEL